jgi:hypothetical protein
MLPIWYARHQFPPAVIEHAVWVYLRFTLSYRDVEDLLAERGLDVSHETVRRWVSQHVQRSTPSDLPLHAAPLPSRGDAAMARRDDGGLTVVRLEKRRSSVELP